MRLAGMAARYDKPTVIGAKNGRYVERIMPGAFRSALKRGDDIALLLNHDPSKLMARVSAGTLRLHEVSSGLAFEADLPDTEYARDAYTSVKRGDLNGCSFGFGPCEDDWDSEGVDPEDQRGRRLPRRSIRNFKQVSDVSVVTFPAYKGTSVEARNVTIGEQRSQIIIPTTLVVPEVPDSDDVRIRRRVLLYNVLRD
jgi:HK97 family phage prohead protease